MGFERPSGWANGAGRSAWRARRWVLATALGAALAAPVPAQDVPAGGAPTAAQVADLILDLGAEAEHVRDEACEELARAGAVAVPALVQALTGANVRARTGAARALGKIGSPARDAIPELEQAMASEDAALADVAKAALAQIDPVKYGVTGGPTPAVEELRGRLASPDPAVRDLAIRQLGEVRGPDAAAAAKALEPLLEHGEGAVRRAALASLGSLGVAAVATAPAIVDSLVTKSSAERAAAVDALARMAGAGVEPALRAAARIGEAQSDPSRLLPWLESVFWDAGVWTAAPARAALASDQPFLAAAGADALGAARSKDPQDAAALIAATRHESGVVRRHAARALGLLGSSAGDAAIDAVIALAGDRGSRSQVEAVDALRRMLADLAEKPARTAKGPADAQRALDAGMRWLVAHQEPDGRWDCDGFDGRDPADDRSGGHGNAAYDTGVTGLAALALLRNGATGRIGTGDAWTDVALRRAMGWLVSRQEAGGRVGGAESQHWIYDHTIGTLALCEAWARTRNPLWGDAGQRALDHLAEIRNPEGAWRYEVRAKDTDVSVNGWVVQALRAGERGGLRADRAGDRFVLAYLDQCTDPEFGDVGYNGRGAKAARTSEMLPRFPPDKSTAMTSSACLQRLLLGRDPKSDPLLAKGIEQILKMPPRADDPGAVDLYSWMAGTELLALLPTDVGRKWKGSLRESLLALQCGAGTGSRAGSWDTIDPWSPDGGRVYTTSAAVLCLLAHEGRVTPLPRDPTTAGPGLRIARALTAAARDAENHESVRAAAREALLPYGAH